MMKRKSTSIRLLLSLILLLGGLVTAPAQTLRFGVIGDYGSGASSERDVANLVKSWSPDLIITVGDNNYPDGAASTIDANIGQFYHSFIYPYTGSYGAGASENRFFPSLGNHDWIASGATPYLNYFSLPNNERYYDFVRGTVHFFALDSDSNEPSGTSSSSTQGNWLKNKLATSTAKWKIVYFHHAPYSSGEHGSTTRMQWPFQQWGATAVLTGHDHAYERILINGFPYFVNGLGGESRYSFGTPISGSVMRYNSDYGAMRVQANGTSSIQFQFYNRGGTLIDTYTIQSTQNPPSLALATSLAGESGPVNGVIDPGERVTVNFTLSNSGGPTTNLVGTLLTGSGVTSPSSAQTYGAIATGASITKPFSFTASGANGATITAVLQLQNGTANLGTVSKSFVLGPNNNLANTSPITIPDSGAGSLYPSRITVSGQPTNPSKVTVTLNGLNHTYPDDVDVLLVGPGGQKVLLMSDAGGNVAINNATLTFDDAATSTLPDGSAIVSGSYKPTDFATGDTFPGPAPTGPYGTALSAFNGLNPNGTWSLYVVDDEAGDAGSLAAGWSLKFTASPSNPSIALTSPASGATFAAPATINLAASVSPNGHTITKVQFYNGATLVGEDASSPYSYSWSSVGAGSYSLTARLVYDAGSTLNSAAANVTVTSQSLPTIALTSPVTGTSYTAPATVNLAASVSPNGHTITKVQFYNGAALVGEDTSSPYSYTWSSVGAGSYSLTARLVYDAGSTLNSAAANVTVTNPPPTGGLTFAATSGAITAPFVASGGTVYQTTLTTLANSGRAAYSFAIVNAGDYVVTANVNAPNDSANSFFVNIDAEPTDPDMVWQIPVTTGLQSRTVSWQANGTPPKVFTLTAGTHQLIVRGREGNTQLGTITISPVTIVTPPIVALTAPVNDASFSAPATINLAASVAANGNTISKVQFYQGSTLLGEDTNAPYGFTWSGVSAGSYNLSARAVYNTGTVASAAVNVNVSAAPSGLTLGVGSATITAPFVVVNGTISQPAYTGVTAGGRAAYTFSLNTAGDYVVSALVNAPEDSANSFFVNMDAEPVDPTMTWDIPLTSGLTERSVSWRGNGTFDAAQFAPKVFNLSAGTHTLIVRGREANTRLGEITIRPASTLPAPWQTLDIGNVGVTGAANIANGLHTVAGAGNISGASDNFRFVYQTLSGDGEIKARLPTIQNTGSNACIGVMIRESLTGGSKYAFMGVDGAGAFRSQRRSSTGGTPSSATSGTGIAPNLWVRVVRSGSTLTGYKSTDGVNWTNVSSGSVSMGTTTSIGLAVASGSSATLNISMFDNVTVVP